MIGRLLMPIASKRNGTLARDFAGNLDSISVMRSVGKESEIIIVVVAEYIESGGEI